MRGLRAIYAASKNGLRHFAAADGGVSAVEFAIITPVLLVIILGMVDSGRAIFNKMELVSAVRSGAQYALGDSSDTSAIGQAVVASTNLSITTGDVTVTEFCECDGSSMTCGGGCGGTSRKFMTVSASMTFDAFFIPDFNMGGTATVRIE